MANWYYERTSKEGKPCWIKVSKPDDEGPLLKEEESNHLILRAEDFQPGDLVEVNHHPPPNIENCRPFEELIEYIKTLPVKPFRTHIFWNSYWPGGMLEVIWKDAPYFVEYDEQNKYLAKCLDMETRELVGIKIEDVANLKLGVDQDKFIS